MLLNEPQINEKTQKIQTLMQQGQYKKALPLAVQLTHTVRQNVEAENPLFAKCLNQQATLHYILGDYRKAKYLQLWGLQINRKTLAPDTPDISHALYTLALVYQATSNYNKAQTYLKEALSLQNTNLAEDDPLICKINNALAWVYVNTGKHKEAIRIYQTVYQLQQQAHRENNLETAHTLHGLAKAQQVAGDYPQAKLRYEQALSIKQSILPENHLELAHTQDGLATLYQFMGDYEMALTLYNKALAIKKTTFNETHPTFIATLNNLASLYQTMGHYETAKTHYKQVLIARQKTLGENHPDYGLSLHNMATLAYNMGNYDKAKLLHQSALQLRRKALGDTHPDLAPGLNQLAKVFQAIRHQKKASQKNELMTNYRLAMKNFEDALNISQVAFGEQHPQVADTLDNLAYLQQYLGDYIKAEANYRQALEIRQAIFKATHPAIATSYNSLATFYQEIRDYERAEPLAKQALSITRKVLLEKHPLVAERYHNLADICLALKQYTEAESYYQQALKIREERLKQHQATALTLNSLGELYYLKGDYDKANKFLIQANDSIQKTIGKEHVDFARSLHNLACNHHSQGDYKNANNFYNLALLLRAKLLGEAHPDYANTLTALATLNAAVDDIDKALKKLTKAATIENGLIEQVFSLGSERQRLAYLTVFKNNLAIFLSLIINYLADNVEAVQDALDLVLQRKATTIEAQAKQQSLVLEGRYPDLQPKLQDLNQLRQQIAQKMLAGPGTQDLETHEEVLAQWKKDKEDIEAALAREIPEMNLSTMHKTINRQKIADALPEGTALVEFIRFNQFDFKAISAKGEEHWQAAHYLAFVLSANTPNKVHLVDLGEAEAIDKLIANFRMTITKKEENRGFGTLSRNKPKKKKTPHIQLGNQLRKLIFDPLLTALNGCTQLFIAPDGDLSRLPFEILPLEDSAQKNVKRIIDCYQLSYLSVGRDLLQFKIKTPLEYGPSLVVANPNFNFNTTAQKDKQPPIHSPFSPLLGAFVEGKQVSALLDVSALSTDEALEGRVKACQSPKILHLSTHGFFLPYEKPDSNNKQTTVNNTASANRLFKLKHLENPLLRSGLALAGANQWHLGKPLPPDAEDGILTAEDVSGLNLTATQLVVLSACETGLGDIHKGEGVFGLQRAFVLAGAKTLVMSLWEVPDKQTLSLVVDFYKRILAGEPKAVALRNAQLAIKKDFSDPFFWGAFICQGDPGPLENA